MELSTETRQTSGGPRDSKAVGSGQHFTSFSFNVVIYRIVNYTKLIAFRILIVDVVEPTINTTLAERRQTPRNHMIVPKSPSSYCH